MKNKAGNLLYEHHRQNKEMNTAFVVSLLSSITVQSELDVVIDDHVLAVA